MFNIHFTQASIDHALQIMEKLAQLPCARPFLLPVDPIRDEVPNYYHVITQPIDISLINEKLLLLKYNYVHEWIRDMFQIRDNAKTFNGANSFIYLLSRRLIEHFEHELKEFYIYNTKLWTKRYQEISKKLTEQMKQIPSILSSQGQSSARVDQLMSQNITSLILSESQQRKPVQISSNSNFAPSSQKGPSLVSKFEPVNEIPPNDRLETVKPILIQRPLEAPQLIPKPSVENQPSKEFVDNFKDDFESHKSEISFVKEESKVPPMFQNPPQPKQSIFGLDKPQSSISGSIFGDIDPLSLPPTLPMSDSPSTSFAKNNPFLNNSSKSMTSESLFPKPASLAPQSSLNFPVSTSIPNQVPRLTQQSIFPQQHFQPQQQINDHRYRTNLYGMVNSIFADPTTISPPEIGPIGNSKPNAISEGKSLSPMSYMPESTMATALTSSSVMNNTDSQSFSPSFKLTNSSKSTDQINEQKKLFIMHYISLFNNFSDMFTLNRIISMHEPQFLFSNNEIDLALLSPSTINSIVNFMGERINSSKSGNNPAMSNAANSNLDS